MISFNKNILKTGVQDFILNNLDTDMMSVLLKKPFFDTVSNSELVVQVESRKKSKKKLPTWFATPKIYYPKKLNIEQTSSEITARYKSKIVDGKSLVDLTGGFGVDSYFFSTKIAEVFHCEINKELAQIAQYNFKILGATNIVSIPDDGITFLKQKKKHFDWLYIDPSRRNDLKGKVFRLSDCIPDVSEHLDLFFSKSDNILIKTSPLLDISKGIKEFKNVFRIHIIAIDNQVKELLWVLKKGYAGEVGVVTRNIQKMVVQVFDFALSDEKQLVSNFSIPLAYLYEPNAAIMKSGGFKAIGNKFDLQKLNPNTHLYTADNLIDFPGRRFKIEKVSPYKPKTFKKWGIDKANVAVRNFPESVVKIKKKNKILDGGERYLFFTTIQREKRVVILAHKI